VSEEKKQSYLDKFKEPYILTTIRLGKGFQADLRVYCLHHHVSMSKFIEMATREKLAAVLEEEVKGKELLRK
jgi:hypothetical protein